MTELNLSATRVYAELASLANNKSFKALAILPLFLIGCGDGLGTSEIVGTKVAATAEACGPDAMQTTYLYRLLTVVLDAITGESGYVTTLLDLDKTLTGFEVRADSYASTTPGTILDGNLPAAGILDRNIMGLKPDASTEISISNNPGGSLPVVYNWLIATINSSINGTCHHLTLPEGTTLMEAAPGELH